MSESAKAYPNNIKDEREAQGLTQSDLSKKTAINRVILGMVESGDMLPRPDHLDKIADALGVSVARLYSTEWLRVIGAAAKVQREAAEGAAS